MFACIILPSFRAVFGTAFFGGFASIIFVTFYTNFTIRSNLTFEIFKLRVA